MRTCNICLLLSFLFFLQCSADPASNSGKIDEDIDFPAPEGWKYYDGDEFNLEHVNDLYWGVYGAKSIGNSAYGQGNQQMVQTYRPEQLSMHKLASGESVCRITSMKGQGAPKPRPPVSDKEGWWSGALSSRDANKFYPLYSRMEIRAKVPNVYGVWHAFWLRYFAGADIAEIDIQEFFVKENGLNKLTQSTHLHNSITDKLSINVPRGQNRTFPVHDPANTFHVYGVQIDPDPQNKHEAIITFLLDGEVTYSFSTHTIPGHNSFIEIAQKDNLMTAWDMAITGQVGGVWVDYPSAEVDKVITEIDWFRCYVRE